MKETTIICDVCKERKGKVKCDFCKNDICYSCGKMVLLECLGSSYLLNFKLSTTFEDRIKERRGNIICRKCVDYFAQMLDDLKNANTENINNLTLEILSFFRKNSENMIVAEKL